MYRQNITLNISVYSLVVDLSTHNEFKYVKDILLCDYQAWISAITMPLPDEVMEEMT